MDADLGVEDRVGRLEDLILLSRCCRLGVGCVVVGRRGCGSSCRSVVIAAWRSGSGCNIAVVADPSLSSPIVSLEN